MLEKIKAIPFVDESAAVKVFSMKGKIILERTDKVIWAQELSSLKTDDDIMCYVEAKTFFALLDDIAKMKQSTCLEVELKNGAKYELPFIDVSWESVRMPEVYHDQIVFKISDLMLTTLQNLIKPELQCIWIDNIGAVSCDIISACLSDRVKATHPFLLPLDVQELVVGRTADVNSEGDTLYIAGSDFCIAVMKPETEDEWYNDLRAMVEADVSFVPKDTLENSLKRLALFDDYVTFDGTKVKAGSNFEPFKFTDTGANPYEIEKLLKILATSSSIAELSNNLILKNDKSVFLISAMEEA